MRLRALACALLITAAIPAASATAAPGRLHLTWRLVTRSAGTVYGAGRYVGYLNYSARGVPFILTDDLTGRRTRISRGGCEPGALSATWVAFDCVRSFRLYNISSHRWRRLPCEETCARWRNWISIAGAGSRWLALGVQPHDPCGDGIHSSCGEETYYFEDIATGRMRAAPSTSDPSMIVDLNSPKLLRRTCPPLQNPIDRRFPAGLVFYGRFALSLETGGTYLERCGSSLRIPLTTGTAADAVFGNRQAVGAVLLGSRTVAGAFLPRLERFTLDLPAFASSPLLGPRHLYASGPRGALWRAVFPAPRTQSRPARPRSPGHGGRA